jgi:hypothetical protein
MVLESRGENTAGKRVVIATTAATVTSATTLTTAATATAPMTVAAEVQRIDGVWKQE